ncbi:MAG: hypothetical protein JWQ82_1619, partial [Tardiphaga sp.]|nr:hypothetical protein [Tardiphaga sp.]
NLDRAEAKAYLDLSAMLAAGVSLERSLGAFAAMYDKDAGLALRALGYFRDGDCRRSGWSIKIACAPLAIASLIFPTSC